MLINELIEWHLIVDTLVEQIGNHDWHSLFFWSEFQQTLASTSNVYLNRLCQPFQTTRYEDSPCSYNRTVARRDGNAGRWGAWFIECPPTRINCRIASVDRGAVQGGVCQSDRLPSCHTPRNNNTEVCQSPGQCTHRALAALASCATIAIPQPYRHYSINHR